MKTETNHNPETENETLTLMACCTRKLPRSTEISSYLMSLPADASSAPDWTVGLFIRACPSIKRSTNPCISGSDSIFSMSSPHKGQS